MANTNKRNHNDERKRDDEQVDLLGISRRDKQLHGIVYALITLLWFGVVIWNMLETDCWNSQQPRTTCIIDAAGSINLAIWPALILTIALIATGRSTRAAFRRMLMVLPVLRDKYAENLQAAKAEGVDIGAETERTRAKQWYERMRRAEQSGEPFNEPPPWDE